MLIGKSLCIHGAFLNTSSQFLPSFDRHTSRGGASYELCHPPNIHIYPLCTTSPCESLGDHAAVSCSNVHLKVSCAFTINECNREKEKRIMQNLIPRFCNVFVVDRIITTSAMCFRRRYTPAHARFSIRKNHSNVSPKFW